MKTTVGYAELQWTCPYKTCGCENVSDVAEQDCCGHCECCECGRKVKVEY